MSDIELKPCPKCGGTSVKCFEYDDGYSVFCRRCQFEIYPRKLEKFAAEAWNAMPRTTLTGGEEVMCDEKRSFVPKARPVFAPCPSCGGKREKLSIDACVPPRYSGFRVQCSCGVCGPYGYDTEEAIIIWNGLFAHTEDK